MGVVIDTKLEDSRCPLRTPRGPYVIRVYFLSVYPGERVKARFDDLRALDSSDHCAMPGRSNACQPRSDGRCVWCERVCAEGTVSP